MAELPQIRTFGLRVLLVALGVSALLGVKSLISSPEEIRLSALTDVVAGSNPEVIVQAEPESTVVLEWTLPSGLTQEAAIAVDEDGESSYRFDPQSLETAGTYALSARYEQRKKADLHSSFEVVPSTPDLAQSSIHFSSSVVNPNQTVQMSVALVDRYGNPVSGHQLSVSSTSPAVQVFSSEFVTDEQGQMNFTLLGNGNGLVELSLFDSTSGQSVLAPTQVALLGGPDLEDLEVQLAESGPVDSFVITGLDNETEASSEQSITVKAIDEDGFTVTDYTGTIRFSSSDDQAELPTDYTFLAEDQGEHTFSLGVKFVTLGSQTLTVTDLEDVQVNGEKDTTVVQDENSTTDYDTDFETTDFERDGDFTLTSPASGSYSEASVEVQGEAEYGYTAVVYVNEEEAGQVEVEFDNSFSYSLSDLSDGTYVIFVEIQDENETLVESSDSETVTIDTTPPDLVSISLDPETDIEVGAELVVTVLSESDLEDSSIVFQEEVTILEETGTAGKYQATIIAPETEGEYSLDVYLSDSLGNEVEYRDELTFTVGASAPAEEPAEEPATESQIDEILGLMAKGGEEKVALSWEAPDSALSIAYYRVYYGPSSESLFAVSETDDASTNWTITDLTAEEYYYFAVTAVDIEGNEGPVSDTVLGIPEASDAPSSTAPSYPVYTTIEEEASETPETGPAMDALLVLSSLGAMAYVLLRKRIAPLK